MSKRLGLILLPFFSVAGLAAPSLDLGALIDSAVKNNGEIKEVEQDVQIALAQQDRAKAAGHPTGSATILGAPIPEFRGNATNSTTNFGKWGPLITGSVELALPLYTFGQIKGYQNAAEHQVLANRELAKMKRSEIILKTKEYYYSLYLAKSLEKVVDDVLSILEEAVVESDKKLKDKNSKMKPNDVYELKTQTEAIRQLRLEAVAGRQTAEKALAWISRSDFEKAPGKKIKKEKFEKQGLDDYLALSRKHRPEFKALKEGQVARAALRDAKKAQSYPAIFLGGIFGFGWSPNADKQQSIFASDPFNRVFGGGGIGLRFDLEFGRHKAEAAEEEAQRLKLKAKESWAVPGIELQVRKAYFELEKAIEGMEIAKRRKKIARKWFVSNASGWTLGIAKARDLMDSLEGDAFAKKNYAETIFSLNMALANLSHAVGTEVTELKYNLP